MNNRIKVTLESVIKFQDKVDCVASISSDLKTQSYNFDLLTNELSNIQNHTEEKITSINEAIVSVDEKKALIIESLSNLESKLSYLENKLSGIQEAMSECNYGNSKYRRLSNAEDRTYNKIEETEERIEKKKNRIDKADSILRELDSQLQMLLELKDAIQEQIDKCANIKDKYDAASNLSYEKSCIAGNQLNKIAMQINIYLSKKIQIDTNKFNNNSNSLINSTSIEKDDNGKTYQINDSLVKNATFVKNGFTFNTDNQGRTISVSGKLRLVEKTPRNLDDMKKVGKGDEKETDDRGHLVARRFGGPDTLENLVPQDHNINTRDYKRFEDDLAKLLQNGDEIYVEVRPHYIESSRRPDALCVVYSVNGVKHIRTFPNESKESN